MSSTEAPGLYRPPERIVASHHLTISLKFISHGDPRCPHTTPASEANFELNSTIFDSISSASSGNCDLHMNFRSASDKASTNTLKRKEFLTLANVEVMNNSTRTWVNRLRNDFGSPRLAPPCLSGFWQANNFVPG